MSLASIQKEIFQLDFQERARLIDLLWESLDESRIKEIEAKCFGIGGTNRCFRSGRVVRRRRPSSFTESSFVSAEMTNYRFTSSAHGERRFRRTGHLRRYHYVCSPLLRSSHKLNRVCTIKRSSSMQESFFGSLRQLDRNKEPLRIKVVLA